MNNFWQGVTFCLLLCGLAPNHLQASSLTPNEAPLLAEIFPSNCHFSGRFSQHKTIKGVPAPLTSTGDFFYSCSLGLVWHTQTPFTEAILYVNNSNNFKVNSNGDLSPLSGITRYIMSNIFVRLLKGDADYFTEEFAISRGSQPGTVILRPESEYIRKGLDTISINKTTDQNEEVTLNIEVLDDSGQHTNVVISAVEQFNLDGKRAAYEQCKALYSDTSWCQVLRSPTRY